MRISGDNGAIGLTGLIGPISGVAGPDGALIHAVSLRYDVP